MEIGFSSGQDCGEMLEREKRRLPPNKVAAAAVLEGRT